VDKVYVTEDISHKGPGYVFGNAGVEVGMTASERLDEIIDEVASRGRRKKADRI